MEQDHTRNAGIVMAALELLPAQSSDLTGILRDPDQFQALIGREDEPGQPELVEYLRENLDLSRIEFWHKRLDRLITNRIAWPILAADRNDALAYPSRLALCWDAPPVLFATAPIHNVARAVAVIGSRAADSETLAATHALAADLASTGVTIVSGLALGVDAAAHAGALAADGHTIAVLGTGITRVYPNKNADLAQQIRNSGALVSQFAPYAPPTRTSFLHRNHVIAGLSDISIIMSGESRSGSRHEIEQAMNYGREVFMWEPALEHQEWARKLADTGQATFIASADQIRNALDRPDL